MCSQMTLWGTDSATSSPESAAGPLPCAGPDKSKPTESGPVVVLVSRFRALEKDRVRPTNDICGPLFTASSPSYDLQDALARQVSGQLGLEWLAGVRLDLEGAGYACGAADLSACGVGAPHIRRRLWWVAHTSRPNEWGRVEPKRGYGPKEKSGGTEHRAGRSITNGLADAEGREAHAATEGRLYSESSNGGAWDTAIAIGCRDGRARRVEPGLCPLAHGVPGRVGRLRGYGNAIVPQVAAKFIRASMETLEHALPLQ